MVWDSEGMGGDSDGWVETVKGWVGAVMDGWGQ